MADVCVALTFLTILLIITWSLTGICTSTATHLFVVAIIIPLCLTQLFRKLRKGVDITQRRVCVLVLGDIGRSPRMQYHALSLSKHRYDVTCVGFLGTKPHQDLLGKENITILPVAEIKGLSVGPSVLKYVTKVILQSLQISFVLLKMEVQSHLFLQAQYRQDNSMLLKHLKNPPGLPSIAVAYLICRLRGTKFIIDWHNYGYTIMALTHGQQHPIVRLAKWYEHFFGSLATYNLCVTESMKDDLRKNWGIRATTLYDKPPTMFKETPVELQHQLFLRLAKIYPEFQTCGGEDFPGDAESTAFSSRNPKNNTVTLTSGRPALLLSSTSWTEDEDFSILLRALEEYEKFVTVEAHLPSLVCVITGKGPQKDFYRKQIESLHLEHVKICTPWLEAEDYPILLGSADLGVSLHKSSSGLDLPMKVVDMFGCCLPVCALEFNCLHELVKHEENGLIFKDSQELAVQLKLLFSDFPNTDGRLSWFRQCLRLSEEQRWDENWDQKVLPLLTEP